MLIDSYKCRSTVVSVNRQLSFSTVVSVDGQLITVHRQLLTVENKNKEVVLMALTSHRSFLYLFTCMHLPRYSLLRAFARLRSLLQIMPGYQADNAKGNMAARVISREPKDPQFVSRFPPTLSRSLS